MSGEWTYLLSLNFSAPAHYPGSGEKMCCGIYTAPSSFFENSGWMNVHGHMQLLYMEPTVAESSAVQQLTINSSSQERQIQKNKSRKRQRRTECPVCLCQARHFEGKKKYQHKSRCKFNVNSVHREETFSHVTRKAILRGARIRYFDLSKT